MAESNVFSEWYTPRDGIEGQNRAQNAFQETLEAFPFEHPNDKEKLNWIIELGDGTIDSVLASVHEARDAYKTRRGGWKVRDALVSFSEKVHYYSGIMDALVSHHPEYVALASGAMKFFFVGVLNHQKHITRLCTRLSRIADTLPRAWLIMLLYPTTQNKQIIIDIYSNYQGSKALHVVHAITKPAELQYDDLLATISSLSRSLIENALASSHAEQRDMHTDITTLVRWKSILEMKIDELMTRLLEVRSCVFAEHAINTSSRMDASQKLSEIQLAQFLQYISVLDLPEPIKAFQASLFMSKRSQARPSNRGPPFWLDAKVQRWNYQVSTIDLLRYLVQQAIKINESIHTDAALSPRYGAHLRAQTEDDWVRVLASVLEGIPLTYIILDIEVLSQSLGPPEKGSLPSAFCGLFTELSSRGIKTIVRIALVGYGSPLLRGPFTDEYRDLVGLGRYAARLAFRNQTTSAPAQGKSVNLAAIANSQQVRGRANRLSHRQRRAR
ncbi:hypothetical protein F4803DRAFT_565677 [Xylaria telfairii]|nr:hypothetical protein F4803DRAFT_565677 [Xylaria telfairii]